MTSDRATRNKSSRAKRRALGIVVVAAASTMPSLAAAQPETEPPPPAAPPPAAPPPATPPPTEPSPTATPEAAPAQPAPAEEKREEEKPGYERTLSDHVFPFPGYVASAVVVSYVGLRVRAGYSTIDTLPSPIGNIDVQALTLQEGLDFGAKITDWFGLFGTAGVRTLVGTNIKGLTYNGATYDAGGQLGAIARLFRSEKTGSQLSLRLSGALTTGQVATLLPIFRTPAATVADALTGNLGDALKTPFSSISYGGSLAYMQGVCRLFGIQAVAGFGGTHINTQPWNALTNTRGSNSIDNYTFAIGIAPSVDFGALGFPIAIMPEYLIERNATSAQIHGDEEFDVTHLLSLGIYYTGRTNLQLGLSATTELGLAPITTQEGTSSRPKQGSTDLVLRYIF